MTSTQQNIPVEEIKETKKFYPVGGREPPLVQQDVTITETPLTSTTATAIAGEPVVEETITASVEAEPLVQSESAAPASKETLKETEKEEAPSQEKHRHEKEKASVLTDAKETIQKGAHSGFKALSGKLAKGGLNFLSKQIQSAMTTKESPKTPPAEEEKYSEKEAPSTHEASSEEHQKPSYFVESAKKTLKKLQSTKSSTTSTGEHSAPLEHYLSRFAHGVHKRSSRFGHSVAKQMRRIEKVTIKDENQRREVLDELAIEKVLCAESDIERRNPMEVSAIQDMNMAFHEITDLIAYRAILIREKLVQKEQQIYERDEHARETGEDIIHIAGDRIKRKIGLGKSSVQKKAGKALHKKKHTTKEKHERTVAASEM